MTDKRETSPISASGEPTYADSQPRNIGELRKLGSEMTDASVRSHGSASSQSDFIIQYLHRKSAARTLGQGSFDWRTVMQERYEVKLESHYKIDTNCGLIGEGEYGCVYIARDTGVPDGRLVAIKKVIKKNETLTTALHKEIRVMKELDHPNICRLLESFEDERHIFLIMEYCEGGELFARIVESKYIDERVAANIIKQVTSALLYAHSRNIAHRDLKPENVVFCQAGDNLMGQIKVIDWGLSGMFEGNDVMRTAVGSITYTAPEVLRRSVGYDTSCDLWSLGVLIYVILCGKPPFWGNQKVIIQRILAAKYPLSGHPWECISAEAKDLVRRLLVGDPAERLSIEEVFQHPFLQRETSQAVAGTGACSAILENLRNYEGMTTFRSLCVSAVARHLDHHNLENVHMVFRELDENGDGVLSLEEVKSGFRKLFGTRIGTDEDIETLFHAMDVGCSGSIDYTEFCAAAVDMRTGINEDVLWSAFRAFDLDDTGKISIGELARTLETGLKIPCADAEAFRRAAGVFIEEYDRSGDKMIDFEEWKDMIRSPHASNVQTISADSDQGSPTGQPAMLIRAVSQKFAGPDIDSSTAYNLLLESSGLGEAPQEEPQHKV